MITRIFIFLTILFAPLFSLKASPLTLKPGNFRLILSDEASTPVRLAAETLCRDFERVMGYRPILENSDLQKVNPRMIDLVIVNASASHPWLDSPALRPLADFEAHRVYVDPAARRIYLYGRDMRGTIYAIYTFSEQFLEVPPLWYFASWEPRIKKRVEIPSDYDYFCKSPQVRYRAG